jgi:hypothetical protein
VTINHFIPPPVKKVFSFFASLKVAIPLLVLLVAITIIGTLSPDPDLFWSWWYLALLGVLGMSLLFITIMHIPLILKRKGRNAMIGVVTTHLGILILIAGIIYGGYSGFRHKINLIEGEVKIVPGLPFVIQLDELQIEEYDKEDFPHIDLSTLPKKKQDSHITLIRRGEPFFSAITAPGKPVIIDGITLLPAINDVGLYFEIIIINRSKRNRETLARIRPWSPPLIELEDRTLMAHARSDKSENLRVEIFARVNGQPVSLGFADQLTPLKIDQYTLKLGQVKRYTGMQVYNRPHEMVLVIGSILMFVGLVWHFYFRYQDRKNDKAQGVSDA